MVRGWRGVGEGCVDEGCVGGRGVGGGRGWGSDDVCEGWGAWEQSASRNQNPEGVGGVGEGVVVCVAVVWWVCGGAVWCVVGVWWGGCVVGVCGGGEGGEEVERHFGRMNFILASYPQTRRASPHRRAALPSITPTRGFPTRCSTRPRVTAEAGYAAEARTLRRSVRGRLGEPSLPMKNSHGDAKTHSSPLTRRPSPLTHSAPSFKLQDTFQDGRRR
jgi:hypothetical protein